MEQYNLQEINKKKINKTLNTKEKLGILALFLNTVMRDHSSTPLLISEFYKLL